MTIHNHKKPVNSDDDIVITDAEVREVFPTEEEGVFQGKAITETEAEEAVGGDMPVDGVSMTNMNTEDEEMEKEADII